MNQNSTPHRINLSAMWSSCQNGLQKRVNLPELDWHQEQLPAKLIRNFNRPTNLQEDSRIILELTQLPAGTECRLNGQSLGICEQDVCRFDITFGLKAGQNRIEIHVGRQSQTSDQMVSGATLELV